MCMQGQKMLVLLLLAAAVAAADFNANLRLSLTSDHVTGYMMISLLQGKSQNQILAEVRNAMGDKTFPENRLRDLFGEANSFGILPQGEGPKLIWRQERLKVAQDLLGRYNNDNSILDRVIAIDELTVLYGKLEIIVATTRSEFVHVEFIKTGKAKNKDMMNFLGSLVDKVKIVKPIILWDNINIHKNKDVTLFFVQKEWEAWPHPVESSDMQPLDYRDFKILKKEWTVKTDMTPEEAEEAVNTAVRKINSRRGLQGINELPTVWNALVQSEGLMTS